MKLLRYLLPLIIGIGIGLGIYHQFVCEKKGKGEEKSIAFKDFIFTSIRSSVPMTEANIWVQNYREIAGRTDLTKVFALNLEKIDIQKFYDSANFGGLRLYFGIKDKTKPNEISIIATGYRDNVMGTDNEDFYLNEKDINGAPVINVVDDMSKCPTMCPRQIANRNMLGLFKGTPTLSKPTDRP